MASRSPSHYLVAEADTDFAPEQARANAPLQNYLRERLLEVRTRNYSNTGIADAKAIEKISSEFEILVFGPARVGKSTLIQELSGDEEIKTSAGLNSCTQTTTAYTDQYGVRWWDTRGKRESPQLLVDRCVSSNFQASKHGRKMKLVYFWRRNFSNGISSLAQLYFAVQQAH